VRDGHRKPHLDLPNFVRSLTERVSSQRLAELRARVPDRQADPVEDRFGLALLLDKLRENRTLDELAKAGGFARGEGFTASAVFDILHAERELTLKDLDTLARHFGVERMLLYTHMFPTEPDVVAGRVEDMCRVPEGLTGSGAVYLTPRSNLALSDVQLLIVELAVGEATRWNVHAGYELALPLAGAVVVEFRDAAGGAGPARSTPEVSAGRVEYAHYASGSSHRLRNAGPTAARVFVARFYG
jgi:hypothetical protein